MSEINRHILSLPKTQQLAIIQAIMDQWQHRENPETNLEIQEKQLGYLDSVAAEVDAGTIPLISLSEFKERVETRRMDRKGA